MCSFAFGGLLMSVCVECVSIDGFCPFWALKFDGNPLNRVGVEVGLVVKIEQSHL